MEKVLSGVTTKDGDEVLDYSYIEHLYKLDEKDPDPFTQIAQRGGQTKFLSSSADIIIYGGKRGGGKSWALLAEGLYDVHNPYFNAIIFRREINDLETIVNASQNIYTPFGEYNCSKNDMTWNFNKGGSLKFNYFSDSLQEFRKRFQGHEYSYIGIDEITHMEYQKFKYLCTCNRNSHFIPNRIFGTCNPDPDSWVAKFIDWWIDDEGYTIPERDGVMRYCFMGGGEDDSPNTIVWGNTREEVYEKKKEFIDELFLPFKHLNLNTTPQEMFIKSVTFIAGNLEENLKLLRSDPSYVSSLAQQDAESIERDLKGNWKYRSFGDDVINMDVMFNFYKNPYKYDDGVRRASCDVAFEGGDQLVLMLFVGKHLYDVATFRSNSQETIQFVQNKLKEWNVAEENFCYDLNGIGQIFKGFFKRAYPFNNRESVDDKYKGQFDTIKSQCAYELSEALRNGELSIESDLLKRKFSAKAYKGVMLEDILMRERKAIKWDAKKEDKGKCLITKPDMKRIVGNSPDFVECMLMFFIFFVKPKRRRISNLGLL